MSVTGEKITRELSNRMLLTRKQPGNWAPECYWRGNYQEHSQGTGHLSVTGEEITRVLSTRMLPTRKQPGNWAPECYWRGNYQGTEYSNATDKKTARKLGT
ncbi:hypothetical protein J6590_004556 [Homalodisca vitripennis]|nr:hypothetical protein J6590_004556 [Homalodisca vitripennis]